MMFRALSCHFERSEKSRLGGGEISATHYVAFEMTKALFEMTKALFEMTKALFEMTKALFEMTKALFEMTKCN